MRHYKLGELELIFNTMALTYCLVHGLFQ